MNEENFPAEERTSYADEEKSSKGKNALTLFLVVALLGTWGYIIYDKNKTTQERDVLTTQLVNSDSAKNELQRELDDAALRLDALKTSNARADSLLKTKDKEIENLRQRVQSIINDRNATHEQLAEARRLLAQLKGNIETYVAEIETLKAQNVQLTEQKKILTEERDVALQNLDSAGEVIQQKEELIDIGSTLHATNFSIIGIQERNRGREKVTTKARKVDKLRISFVIDENRLTTSGPKDIYVAITGPDGRPISIEELGSGTFITRDGTEKPYTKKVQIYYEQGKKMPVTLEWSQEKDFQTGNYKIEIYNNGFKIGEGIRAFKKGGLFG